MKIRLLHITLFWLSFGVMMFGIMVLVHPITTERYSVVIELLWNLGFGIVWIPGTLVTSRIAQRFFEKDDPLINTILYLSAIGFAVASVLCLVHGLFMYLISPEQLTFTANYFLRSLFYNIDKMLIVYTALMIMHYALSMHRKHQEKELKAAQLESQLAHSQMQALKMQVQPHFLFNTLNAIVTLIHKDQETAEMMLIRLSDFLRMTLDSGGKQLVSLQDELSFIKAYLEIEQVRFQDRLSLRFETPSETLDKLVPSLILQPLVENAIKHGISASAQNGEIVITAYFEGESLKVAVKDNGQVQKSTALKTTDGIGLSNVRARLIRMYGDDASVQLLPRYPQGTEALITIPLHAIFQER